MNESARISRPEEAGGGRLAILGTRVSITEEPGGAVHRILDWARRQKSRYVCFANVHMVMDGHDDPAFQAVVNGADLVLPDGMPLVWCLRRRGYPDARRVSGPDTMEALCREAARAGIPIGLYGGRQDVLEALKSELERTCPGLSIPYSFSPPFRSLEATEEARILEEIGRSGARLLFVGLGCPKQEKWMAESVGRVPAVMLGVGAAFDFISGTLPRAPRWMRESGLEWLHRFLAEPRRLLGRYLRHNPRFMLLAAREIRDDRHRTLRGPGA